MTDNLKVNIKYLKLHLSRFTKLLKKTKLKSTSTKDDVLKDIKELKQFLTFLD